MAAAPIPCPGVKEAEPVQQLPISACRSCECWRVHLKAQPTVGRQPPAMRIVLGHLVCAQRVPEYVS